MNNNTTNKTSLKKKLSYVLLPILGVAILGVGINAASAHGLGFGRNISSLTTTQKDELASRQQTMFQSQADLLGISVDEVKAAWAAGKTFQDLAKEHNISETDLQAKMKAARLAGIKAELQLLVDKGVITQAQADQRLNFMETNQNNMMGPPMGGRGHHGFGF